MLDTILGIFFILHGLVHLWYVVLSFNWVNFLPEMGWTGKSWLLSPIFEDSTLRMIAGLFFIIAAVAFTASGISVLLGAKITQQLLLWSAIFSSITLILFWDGQMDLIVQKGLIGLLINLVTIIVVLI